MTKYAMIISIIICSLHFIGIIMALTKAFNSQSKFDQNLNLCFKVVVFIALCFIAVHLFRIAFKETPDEVLFDNYLFKFQTSGFNSQSFYLGSRPSHNIAITRGYKCHIVANKDVTVNYFYRGAWKQKFLAFGDHGINSNVELIQIVPTVGDTKVYIFSKINY